MISVWRLLVTEPCDGATNMAIDEAVWRGRQAGISPPTVRFFAWAPPTVSLGYGQPLDQHVNVEACRRLGVGIVRRPTGGSAIYHDGPERELTYSVVASTDDLGGVRDLLGTYQWIGRALVAGLRPNTEVTFTMSRGVVILKKVATNRDRGDRLVEAMRGRATTGMSTDQILALTRR